MNLVSSSIILLLSYVTLINTTKIPCLNVSGELLHTSSGQTINLN
jgi:hypothetical protein